MNLSKIIVNTMAYLKPFLVKVIPLSFLHRCKVAFMNRATDKLKNENIKSFVPERYGYKAYGVNLIGCIQSDTGLGQSCRLLARELEASGIPFGVTEFHADQNAGNNNHSCDEFLVEKPEYGINLFHINANEFTYSYQQLGRKYWDYHYNIAFWLWELEEFPDRWVGCIDVLDEIWTPAEFVSEAIRKKTNKPVYTVPYHVEAPIDEKYDRGFFGLPEEQFLFLMMYDSSSMMERKNPLGTIEAFKKAFPDKKSADSDVGLVIKLNGHNEKEVQEICSIMDGYNNIHIMTERLTKIQINSLIADVDVFVSLHRAEGFGLVMAESMLNGTPCIATNWSANTEFMNDDVACMVDYEIVELDHEVGPYRKGSHWAEPEVEQAAEYMRRLQSDRNFGQRMAQNAREDIRNQLGMESVTRILEQRVNEIKEG